MNDMRTRLVETIARIARHACYQGEQDSREWPHLYELPLAKSWLCVGEKYADEVLATLLIPQLFGPEEPSPKPPNLHKD